MTYLYGRAGLAVDFDKSNQIAVSAEYGRERLHIVGYKLTSNTTFDFFTGGIAGRDGVGYEMHSGFGLRVQF